MHAYMQQMRCPTFQYLRYHVTLLGFDDAVVNDSSCGRVCTTTFRNFTNTSASDGYTLSLYAGNSIGTSDVINYPTTIGTLHVSAIFEYSARYTVPYYNLYHVSLINMPSASHWRKGVLPGSPNPIPADAISE